METKFRELIAEGNRELPTVAGVNWIAGQFVFAIFVNWNKVSWIDCRGQSWIACCRRRELNCGAIRLCKFRELIAEGNRELPTVVGVNWKALLFVAEEILNDFHNANLWFALHAPSRRNLRPKGNSRNRRFQFTPRKRHKSAGFNSRPKGNSSVKYYKTIKYKNMP